MKALEILCKEIRELNIDIIFIQNSEIGNNTLKKIREFGFIYNPKNNIGTAAAYNYAAYFAIKRNYSHLLLCDQDSTIGNRYLQKCIEIINEERTNKIFTPKNNENNIFSFNQKISSSYLYGEKVYKVFDAKASGMLIPINILKKIQFNEKLFVDYVDWAFCWDSNKYGFEVYEFDNISLKEHNLGNKYNFANKIYVNFPSKFRRLIQNNSAKYLLTSNKYLFRIPLSKRIRITFRLIINPILNFFERFNIIKQVY